MASTDLDHQELIARFANLKEPDRRAVLKKLPPEQREIIGRSLRDLEDAQRKEQERRQLIDRQFLGYSPWLAKTIEACDGANNAGLTKNASMALWAAHLELRAVHPAPVRKGWFGLVDNLTDFFTPRSKAE